MEKQTGKVNEWVPGILEKKLHEHFPTTKTSVGFIIEPDNYSAEGTPYIQLRMLCTDSTFFRVFPQVIVSGDARQPLQILNNIVLTETVAMRLFGNVEKAIGQQIKSTMFFSVFGQSYTVTAVVKDPPPNTNLLFDVILFSDMQNGDDMPVAEQWKYFNQHMYVKFHPNTDVNKIAEQMRDFTLRLEANANIELRILPIGDIRHQLINDLPFTLNFIRLFFAIGIFLLFSALFNFLSFHIDLFRQRIREFRQRTVHGATSRQLVVQMMFELYCIIFIALALTFCFVILARPVFSVLLNIEIEMSRLINLFAVCGIWVMVLMLFIGLIPFLRLSYLAMSNLSKRKITGTQPLMRRMAVTLQLTVSIVVIIAALVVMMQIRFVNRKDLGFDSRGIIQLSGLTYMTEWNVQVALMRELAAIPQIENISSTYFEPQHNTPHFMMVTEVE